jgi:hypothetical protein
MILSEAHEMICSTATFGGTTTYGGMLCEQSSNQKEEDSYVSCGMTP